MTEESSTASHLLSVAMTTTGMTLQNTSGGTRHTVTSHSPPRGIEFYFQIAVLVIGVLGTAANALILYALLASKQHQKNALIVHQNALDLFASFSTIVSYATKLCDVRLAGSVGYWLCALVLSDCLGWWATNASAINLAVVTVERYLKVVYPVWSQNRLRAWMTYSAMATAWIVSFVNNVAVVFPTSDVVDGACYAYANWTSRADLVFQSTWNFLSYYVVILFIFVFCYWRILLVIRRQARVMAGRATSASNAAHSQYNQIQTNVIKTMIFVSACYAISWMPAYIHMFIVTLYPSRMLYDGIYYGFSILAYSYMCTNPFIYAVKLDPVRRVLLRLIPCRKISEQSSGSGT